jgi:uncharacterized protein (TIGR00645 family)
MGKRMHEELDTKKDPPEAWLHKHFEPAFFNMRYIILIPVFITFVGAFIMFIIGAFEAWSSITHFFEVDYEGAQLSLILGIDAFLLGLVLLIFSYGIYDLFLSKFDIADRPSVRPNWMRFKDIGELKIILAQVILIILTINFFELVFIEMNNPESFMDFMIIPVGIILISLGLGIFERLTRNRVAEE